MATIPLFLLSVHGLILTSKMADTYIVVWDSLGLESLFNVTQMEKDCIVNILKEKPVTYTNPIQHMILRAKFNPQRHYEIYAFESEVSEVSIREAFESTPQEMANTIREIGHKIYSDREKTENRVIW